MIRHYDCSASEMIGRSAKQPSPKGDTTNMLELLMDSRGGTLLLCLTFSLVMVYHFVIPLSAILSTNGTVWNDPAHSIWSLWLVNENVTSGRSPYATNMVFYPVGARLIHPTVIEGFFPVTFLVPPGIAQEGVHEEIALMHVTTHALARRNCARE